MKFTSVASIALAVAVAKVRADCFASRLGYPCCSSWNTKVEYTDNMVNGVLKTVIGVVLVEANNNKVVPAKTKVTNAVTPVRLNTLTVMVHGVLKTVNGVVLRVPAMVNNNHNNHKKLLNHPTHNQLVLTFLVFHLTHHQLPVDKLVRLLVTGIVVLLLVPGVKTPRLLTQLTFVRRMV